MTSIRSLSARWSSPILAVVIGSAMVAGATAQSLVHRWSFDNDYLDTSGSANHGTPAGTPAFVAGKFGQAVALASATMDGVNLDFGAANLPLAGTDPWAMNVWVNLAEPLANLEYIAGFSLDNGFLGAVDNGRARGFISQTGIDNNDFYFWGANADRASGVDYDADGQWHMYTVSYDGTNLSLYKDASLVLSAPPAPNAFQQAYDEVHVGNPSQWNNNFDGSVDEFTIFNGPLSAPQIGGLFVNNDVNQPVTLNPSFTVNRDTGEITLTNDSSFAVDVLGYTIHSASGSLKPMDWDTIAGRFDSPSDGMGDGSIDPNHNWEVLTNTSDTFSIELSEGVPGTDGGTIAIGKVVDFGASWAKNPVEDLSIDLLLNDGLGTIKTLTASFIGNGGNPFVVGDFDGNGAVNILDWQHFRTQNSVDLAGATETEAYLRGDLDGDLDKDIYDFDRFVRAYDAANGGAGAFQAMLASVPEPNFIGLFVTASIGIVLPRWRRSHLSAALAAVFFLSVRTAPATASLIGLYQFNGTGAETTGSNVNLNLVGDAGYAPSLDNGLGQALSLDGVGDGAIGQNFIKIQTSDASVVAWVYATNTDGNFDSIVKQWGDVRGQFHLGLGPSATDTLSNEYGRAATQSTTLTAATPNPFPLNEWVHVAFTLDSVAGFHRLYVNGDEVASAAYPGPGLLGNKATGGNPTGLGVGIKPNTAGTGPSAGSPGEWAGYIDEVGIYDHALSQDDIRQIIANARNGVQLNGLSVPEPGAFAMLIAVAAVIFAMRRRCEPRRTILSVGIAVVVVMLVTTDTQAALHGYYKLNGDANESTGNNINLNLVGDASFASSLHPGLGFAITLDGNGDGAIGESFNKIQTNDVTAVAWVYATSVEGTWDSIVKQWGDVRGQFHFGLGGGAPAGTGDFLQNEYATAQNTSVNLTAPSTFPVNQWVHVAFVLDSAAGQHRLFINGDEIASTAYAGTLANKATGATGLGIGVKPNTAGTAVSAGAAGYWNGSIEEVGIFDHALSEVQIEEIITNSQAGIQLDGTTVPFIRLEVNRGTGVTTLINETAGPVSINAYQISSPSGRLQPADWDALGGNTGFPVGDGSGNGWEQDAASNPMQLLETYFSDSSPFGNGLQISLGDIFAGGTEDLVLSYRTSDGYIVQSLVDYVGVAAGLPGDYNNNGTVDAADYVVWRNGGPLQNESETPGSVTIEDYNFWRSRFGMTLGSGNVAVKPVPEPTGVGLLVLAALIAGHFAYRPRPAQ